jgi:dihydroxyacid dehydratase/phosphogluconate dehydratase
MVWEDLTPEIQTRPPSTTPSRVHMAMGGSTNAIIHLIAMARRAGISLERFRRDFSRKCR